VVRWSLGAVPDHGVQPQAGGGVERAERIDDLRYLLLFVG
jgi:hypothetical protein